MMRINFSKKQNNKVSRAKAQFANTGELKGV